MAQLVERLVRNEEASGSNPLSSTKEIRMAFAVRISLLHELWEPLNYQR